MGHDMPDVGASGIATEPAEEEASIKLCDSVPAGEHLTEKLVKRFGPVL